MMILTGSIAINWSEVHRRCRDNIIAGRPPMMGMPAPRYVPDARGLPQFLELNIIEGNQNGG